MRFLILLLLLSSCGNSNLPPDYKPIVEGNIAVLGPNTSLYDKEPTISTVIELNPISGKPMLPYRPLLKLVEGKTTYLISQEPYTLKFIYQSMNQWKVTLSDRRMDYCSSELEFEISQTPTLIYVSHSFGNCQIELIDFSSVLFPLNIQNHLKYWDISDFETITMLIGERIDFYMYSNGHWVNN